MHLRTHLLHICVPVRTICLTELFVPSILVNYANVISSAMSPFLSSRRERVRIAEEVEYLEKEMDREVEKARVKKEVYRQELAKWCVFTFGLLCYIIIIYLSSF